MGPKEDFGEASHSFGTARQRLMIFGLQSLQSQKIILLKSVHNWKCFFFVICIIFACAIFQYSGSDDIEWKYKKLCKKRFNYE